MPIDTITKTMEPAARFLLAVIAVALVHSACSPRAPTIAGAAGATERRGAAQALGAGDMIFFDDFSYESRAAFASHGWVVRTAPGWPGIAGAVWNASNVSFLEDTGNRVLRMTSSLGESVSQTQICQQRKFLEGTYAARVRFTDTSLDGTTGDEVVESFYTITPYRRPMDPAYSEIDFEYLPGGGWQKPAHTLMMTSWETTQMELSAFT